MKHGSSGKRRALVLALGLALTAVAAEKKELRYVVGAGSSVTIVNQFGPVTLRPSSGGQVIVTATPRSDKVEIDSNRSGNRLTVSTHFLGKVAPGDGRVDYDVQVPPDASINIRCASGPVHVERVNGDISVEGDAAQVEISDVNNAHVHVRSVEGAVSLANIHNGHVEITSVGGRVTLNNVSGRLVSVNTTGGSIQYDGDFASGGEYTLSTHNGNIDVALPAGASLDMTARSVKGSVENDFPFQPLARASTSATEGKSFAGTSNAGASSVRLRSFSGKIRVKKK